MNPHKKTLIDEASGISYENQRYLDYEQGAREERVRLGGVMQCHLEYDLGSLIEWCKALKEE